MNRTTARENAFILIFEKNFRDDSVEDIIADAIEARDFEYDDFVENCFRGVFQNAAQIDEVIETNLRGWTIGRISRVALSILRLSIYEIMFLEDVPTKVSINEAVELAKKYSTADDASFINGVLGSYVTGAGKE